MDWSGDTPQVEPIAECAEDDRMRDSGVAIEAAVGACLLHAIDARQVELAADALGASGDERAIPALLMRLADETTRDDADVEDAVCSALVNLEVMERRGNLSFALRPLDELPATAGRLLAADLVFVPRRYRLR